MKDFKQRFISQLINEEPLPPRVDLEGAPEGDEMSDEVAFNQTLDQDTDTSDFDVSQAQASASELQAQQRAGQTEQIRGWIDSIGEFTSFLNDLGPESIQSKISGAECDTLLADISKTETKHIARIAQELSGLGERLKGFVNTNDDA
jgi:hypothetical protein